MAPEIALTQAYYKGEVFDFLPHTIGEKLAEMAAQMPLHEAIVMPHQNIRWTYAELNARIDELAHGLLRLDIGKGDRVGIWSPNRIEWVLTQFATAKIGAILVCLNPAYRGFDLEFALVKSRCKALIAAERFKTSAYLDILATLIPELATCALGELRVKKMPDLQVVIRMGEGQTPGMYNFAKIMQQGAQMAKEASSQETLARLGAELSPEDPINIQFTSGTTGRPKGAMLTHSGILNNAYFCAQSMRLSAQDRLCIPVPLYHCFGMVLGTLSCLSVGATMVLPSESFDAQTTLAVVAQEKCTALHGVPTMFIAQFECADFNKYDLSALRTGVIAGSICPAELMGRLIDDMDLSEIIIAYGQTECSPITTATAIEDEYTYRISTVGRAHYNWELKICRSDGSLADIGEQGEICARGYGIMDGYWDEPELSAAAIDEEGYLHSGDLGEMDAQGYIKITGRIKDMILRGGENIYPREIEEFLYTYTDIIEVQVFGIPDALMGESVCAWVQIRENSTLNPQDIQELCRTQLAYSKVPKHIKFVDEFPMTVSGKIQKFVMRDAMLAELQVSGG